MDAVTEDTSPDRAPELRPPAPGAPPATAGRDDIRDLQATADFFGVSMPTVRDWIRHGCPVALTGGNGIPYEISLRAVAGWLKDRTEVRARAAEERAEMDTQLRL